MSDTAEPRIKFVLHIEPDQKASKTNSVKRKTKEINTPKLRHFHEFKISCFLHFSNFTYLPKPMSDMVDPRDKVALRIELDSNLCRKPPCDVRLLK